MLQIVTLAVYILVMTAIVLAFKWGGLPFLAGALLSCAVYELGYRSTRGRWLRWDTSSD
jgi:hypothetical protein